MRAYFPIRPAVGDARRQQGFSLLELMVTVIVLGLIAAIAVPSFAELRRRTALSTSANEIVAAVQTARMEAIRLNAPVEVACAGAGCAQNRWERLQVRQGATVIREHAFPTGVTVRGSTNVAGNNNRLRFGADGFASMGASRAGAIGACSTEMRDATNGVDVMVNVSRVSTNRRAATSACNAPPNTLTSDSRQ